MLNIQKEREITRHPNTTQYSVWILLNNEEQETEFIYIFSHLFRMTYLKTDREIIAFIDSITNNLLIKIEDYQKQNEKTLFDFIRYRFVFQIEPPINTNENSIGFTGNKSDNLKIKSFYFSNPNEAINFYIT